MQSYKSHLSLLQATGSNPRLSQIKPPQLLLDFFVDQVETQTAIFNGKPSKSDLQELLRRIMRKAKPCYSSVVVAMFYLDRLWRVMSIQATSPQGPKLSQFGKTGLPEVLAAFILADKYLYDIALANCEWAKVSGTHSVTQVNSYEREFFGRLGYNIQFSEQEYLEFVSFLEVSLTIRHHRMQATADFPLTYADLCHVAEEAETCSSSSESLMDTTPSSPSSSSTSLAKPAIAANRRPTEATLISLRAMMICCVTYCAVMFTVTAAVQGVKASVELKRQQGQAAAAATNLAAGYGNSSNKPVRHGTISRSESWNGCSSSASALPKPTGRKFSDAMMEDSNPWFLQATSGRIRS